MWRMLSLSKIHSFGQVLYGYWSSAVYTVACTHTKRYVQFHQRWLCSHQHMSVWSPSVCVYLRIKYTITVTWLKTLLSQILNFDSCTLWHQIREVAENSKTWISLVEEYRKKISLSFSISERSKKEWTNRSGGKRQVNSSSAKISKIKKPNINKKRRYK